MSTYVVPDVNVIDGLNHRFKTKPYPHQLACFKQSKDLEAFAVLADMGTGKSHIIVNTAAWLYGQGKINALLIVAPKSLRLTWANDEIPTHMPDAVYEQTVLRVGKPSMYDSKIDDIFGKLDPIKLYVLVINIDALSTKRGVEFVRRFLLCHDAMMVIDESTTIKNSTNLRSKAASKLGKLACYRRILTGTPVTKSPLDVFGQFNFLDPEILGCSSYYAFKNHYATLALRRMGSRAFNQVTGYQNIGELKALIAPHSFRVVKEEVLKDLPAKVYSKRYVELGPNQTRIYDQLKHKMIAEIEAGKYVSTQLAITQLLRLHQIVSGWVKDDLGQVTMLEPTPPKLTAVHEIVESLPEDAKVIIWACYVKDVQDITASLNAAYPRSAAAFYGQVTADRRQEIVRQFQDSSSNLRFFVGQADTGGRGLTLTTASVVIYYSNDYDLEIRLQSEDRAHRIGQESSVLYVDLIVKGTVDEKIVEALRSKRSLASEVTGDNLRAWL